MVDQTVHTTRPGVVSRKSRKYRVEWAHQGHSTRRQSQPADVVDARQGRYTKDGPFWLKRRGLFRQTVSALACHHGTHPVRITRIS